MRAVDERITDIRAAIARCLRYTRELDGADDQFSEMAVDAIERNIVVIGEAASHLPSSVTDAISDIDWPAVRGMRNILVHEYFGVDRTIVRDVVDTKLRPIDEALRQYESRLS